MNRQKDVLHEFGITRADIALTAALLAVCAAAGGLFYALSPKPNYVSVKVNGEELCRLPLDTDTTYQIADGNTIEIAGGKVRMIYANCPDKICMHTGEISESGQSIVCTPNRVVVAITGGNDHHAYDVQTK